MSNHEQLIQQLQAIGASPPPDRKTRRAVLAAINAASLKLEDPLDVFDRVISSGLQLHVAKVVSDLNLFERLAEHKGAVDLNTLADESKADPTLLRRLLRYLSAVHVIAEVDVDCFAACEATQLFAHPGHRAGVNRASDIFVPCWNALPGFFAANGYQNGIDGTKAPFQKALDTDLHAFEYAREHPEIQRDFNAYMAALRNSVNTWLSVFPRSLLLQEGDGPLLVDVGGGVGGQCVLLKTTYPEISRPIILQDRPSAISQVRPTDGIEATVYDFFTPQPIKGATFYYMRNILHDWPDADCRKILKMQASAMDDESSILIDEVVVPDSGADWKAADLDLRMMCLYGAMERTESQWGDLFEAAGLEIAAKYTYEEEMGQSVLVLKRK